MVGAEEMALARSDTYFDTCRQAQFVYHSDAKTLAKSAT
ncbi:protein of unknown function [Stenotrophomonas maltophilia]|nr:protein of unknown function [Stenotrophomonas maltophilia]